MPANPSPATGRRPNTPGLACAAAGIELDPRGYVKIDEHFRTTAEGVYAIGDVAGQPQCTHVSWEDYRRVRAILDGRERTRSDRVLGFGIHPAYGEGLPTLARLLTA